MAGCSCVGGVKLVYACSGASGFVEPARGAGENIVIDGCGVNRAKKILEMAGARAAVFTLTDRGYVKGKTPPSDPVVDPVAATITSQILHSGCCS